MISDNISTEFISWICSICKIAYCMCLFYNVFICMYCPGSCCPSLSCKWFLFDNLIVCSIKYLTGCNETWFKSIFSLFIWFYLILNCLLARFLSRPIREFTDSLRGRGLWEKSQVTRGHLYMLAGWICTETNGEQKTMDIVLLYI